MTTLTPITRTDLDLPSDAHDLVFALALADYRLGLIPELHPTANPPEFIESAVKQIVAEAGNDLRNAINAVDAHDPANNFLFGPYEAAIYTYNSMGALYAIQLGDKGIDTYRGEVLAFVEPIRTVVAEPLAAARA